MEKEEFKASWNSKHNYLDMTTDYWANLSHSEQVHVAKLYQNWYAAKLGVEVEKEMQSAESRFYMVLIPPGRFWMGSPKNESKRENHEGPRHKVVITKAFWLAKYEVTQNQWQKVMGSNPSYFKNIGKNAPVEEVSWYDCQEFCRNTGFCLPTEAEWEYACRAGTLTPFNLGDNITPEQVNYNGRYPYKEGNKGIYRRRTVPVGALPNENAWGLYDMHGNVWEWCSDWYGKDFYKKSSEEDPKGPSSALFRVSRGGGFCSTALYCRSASRVCCSPENSFRYLGLRPCTRVN